ncbi:MAG: TIGR00375 family protein [Candidatus Diapherotrites archaeon]|uniref:TIGR00375 family protein n=1 Tax=Candidatus Iainarchaeum sp. TaxID=3101447 RepID=A0A8T3YR53_9ARCH|nr:TIGR00375 family protein [Candidatus Diapherotrites archaeon]
MKEYNLDLQIHGKYAGGVSKNMEIPTMAEQARLKGLDVLVTGDILHAKWAEHVKKSIEEESNGIYRDREGKCGFIIGGEIEDNKRIHHLFYMPSLESAQELRGKILGTGALDCVMCGRPKLRLTAEQFAERVHDAGGIFGPAHSFTPYTGVYAFFDSLKDAYGGMHRHLSFIELGLSADTDMADTISENHGYSFLTSSDAHSPWPNRIGREFMRTKMDEPGFNGLKKAFADREGGTITLNAGLDPREGKYHCTACNSCFSKYSMAQAEQAKWKCLKCGGPVKRGVRDRIAMLADTPEGKHPAFRPKYMHLLPLAEIIQLATGAKGVQTKAVQSRWISVVEKFGNEINALVDAKESELIEADREVGENIAAFRKGLVLYIPGGGGEYGRPIICRTQEELERKKNELKKELSGISEIAQQSTLGRFA